jgi:hypothetical protein
MIIRDFMFVRNPDFSETNPFPRPIHVNQTVSAGVYFKLRDADFANLPILYFILEGEDFGEPDFPVRTETSFCTGFGTADEFFFSIDELFFSTRFTTPGSRTFTITAELCDQNFVRTGQILHRRSFTIQVQPATQSRVRIVTPDGTFVSDPADASADAHLPLGGGFTVGLISEQGDPISASFTLGAATVSPPIDATALFPDRVVLEYSQAGTEIASFQAVHLGSVVLTMAPQDSSLPAAQVNLLVENPRTLGTTNGQFDSIIIELAHSRGLLPQYIKAIAHHESAGTFDGRSYRYEPIGPSVGDLDVISHGLNLRVQAPYRDYRLATADYYGPSDRPLSEGADILPDDINPRALYFITRPDCEIPGSVQLVRRRIKPCDRFVGADEIYFDNRSQNWWRGRRGQDVQDNPTLLSFTAQTGLASSYGLMQITYVTAIGFDWPGITGNMQFRSGLKNPSFLFDTGENHQLGGGSLQLGTDVITHAMLRRLAQIGSSASLQSEADLRKVFRLGLNRYNQNANYPGLVAGFVDRYSPVPDGPVF